MKFRQYTTAWSCGALLVVISLSQTLCKTPLLRIIELDICRSYYQIYDPSVIQDDGLVDEELCKIFPVQQKLATINGFILFFSALLGSPSFSFSMPSCLGQTRLKLHRFPDGIPLHFSVRANR